MALSDTAIRQARPRVRPYKLFDRDGLYLLVNPNGSRWWRFKYRHAGKEKLLSVGTYPEVGLKQAREKREAARKECAAGIDPAEKRKAEKLASAEKGANTFEVVAREWFAKFSKDWATSHADKIMRRFELYVFPHIGKWPVSDIQPPDLLRVLRKVESRGILETAHRVHQNCGQVFRYALATGRADRDPSADLRGSLAPWQPKHYATITDAKGAGDLLRDIDGYTGSPVTYSALRMAPLVFVRPGELRRAEWSEFDFDAAEWRIPEKKMKARVTHIVPLSRQVIEILDELRPLTGTGKYLFPSVRTNREPMSENTINAALRRLGYPKERMTGHGFRSMASTMLNEQGWNGDAIERQLAHGERDKTRASYNYAEYLPERRKMMQAWADYLDVLKREKVVSISHKKKGANR